MVRYHDGYPKYYRKSGADYRFIYDNIDGWIRLGAQLKVVLVEHLTSEELAAFLSNTLNDAEREHVERHLVACSECRAELVQSQRAISSAPIAQQSTRRSLYLFAPVAAAAAVLFAMWQVNEAKRGPMPVERAETVGSPAASVLVIVSPAANAEVDVSSPRFTWRSEDDASYRLTVTDDSGRPLWTESTSDTTIALPSSITLRRGQRFFWYVDALRSDGRSITSGINGFTTAR